MRPRLPPGVDPALKRVPGMSIDFADYQDMVQAFFEAGDRVNPRTASDEEVAAVEELAVAMAPHQEIFSAWTSAQAKAHFRWFRIKLWGTFSVAIVLTVIYLAWFVNRSIHFL